MSSANKYVVEKRVGDSDWEVVGTVEGVKSFRVSDLTPDTSYDFRVKGVNEIDGEEYSGEYSDVVSVRTLAGIDVAVPTGLSVGMDWDSAVLSWDSVEGATGYELQYKSLNEIDWVGLSRTDLLTQTVSSLSEGVSYDFRLRAVVVYGDYTFYSDWTEVINGVTLVRVPSVPLDLVGEPFGDLIDVSWGVSSLATRYVLEFRIQDGQFSELYTGTDFSYRHLGLTVNTDYFYRVKAVRDINGIISESSFTSEIQVNSGQIRLAVPSDFSLTSSDYTSADFSWVAVPSATSYEVSYLKGESVDFVVAGTFKGTTANISGLSDGYVYKFRIRAVGSDGSFSDYSDLLSFSLPLYMLSAPILDPTFSIEGAGDVFNNPSLTDLSGVLEYRFSQELDVDFADFFLTGLSEDGLDFVETPAQIGALAGVYVSLIELEKESTDYFVRGRFKRTVNGVDYFSDYSNVIEFTTGFAAPGELYEINKVVNGLNVTFSWVYNEFDKVSEGVRLSYQVSGDSLVIGSDLTVMGESPRGTDTFDYTFTSAGTYDVVLETYRVLNGETIYTDRARVFWGLSVS